MNLTQVGDRVSRMCLAGNVVAFWSLSQEVAGSNNPYNYKCLTSVTRAKLNEKMAFRA